VKNSPHKNIMRLQMNRELRHAVNAELDNLLPFALPFQIVF